MNNLAPWALGILLSLFVGYLGGYLRRKGENLATHEDLDKLIAQVSAVTETTKLIEAKISNEMWDRQRRWELKRDILFETARKASGAQAAINRLNAVYAALNPTQQKEIFGLTKIHESAEAWLTASGDFDGMVMVASASCGRELVKALLEFSVLLGKVAAELIDEHPNAMDAYGKEIAEKSRAIAFAVRKELELPPL